MKSYRRHIVTNELFDQVSSSKKPKHGLTLMKRFKTGIILLFSFFSLYADNETDIISHDTLPQLQHLSIENNAIKIDSTIITSSDSAVFTAPPLRTPLSGSQATISIRPKCTVDSVLLFVRHSGSVSDTLLQKDTPPFKVDWNFANLIDQDQIHLQFGYTLFHTNGTTIHSSPFPHQWVIDRIGKHSRKKLICKEIIPPDTIIIDGNLNEWPKKRRGDIGSTCSFALRWTSKFLYFAATVTTTEVSPRDMLELHLDPNWTRTSFATHEHRSIRFSPRGRTFCFVSSYNDSLGYFTQDDSIASLLLENLHWSSSNTATGYTIEAAIPYFGISDRDFPKLKSGFDVSVRKGNDILSWANKGTFNRYNPSEWGTLKLRQAMLPLKIFMFAGTIIIGIIFGIITVIVIRQYIQNERTERKECNGGSDELQQLQEALTQTFSDSSLTLSQFAERVTLSPETITEILSTELGCDFERFLEFKRISVAKLLLWDFTLPHDQIASKCGFRDTDTFLKVFKHYYHTDPDAFRESVRDMKEEEEVHSPEKTDES